MSDHVALHFARDPAGRTFLAQQFVTYPFFLTKPFYLDQIPAGMLTLILQSVSGGIYQNERLSLSFSAGAGVQVHCTTQSATVVHSMADGQSASQTVKIFAAEDSLVEYLPDPLVLFPHADIHTRVQVVAEPGATVIVSDAFLTHDPQGQQRPFRSLFSETMLQQPDGRPVCVDRFQVSGNGIGLTSPGILQHYSAQGTLWLFSQQQVNSLMVGLRHVLDTVAGLYAGVSLLPNNAGLWARLLAEDAVALSRGLQVAWVFLRHALTGHEPANRRKSAGL